MTRSAQAPSPIRPSRRSPSTRAGTADASVIARAAVMPGRRATRRTSSGIVAALPASVPSSRRTTRPSLCTERPDSSYVPGGAPAADVWSVVSAIRVAGLTRTSCSQTAG